MNILSNNDKALRQFRNDLTAQGIITENMPVALTTTSTAYTSGKVHGQLLNLRAGDSIAGIWLRNQTAAAGTFSGTGRFGLTDSTGTMLISSSNYNTAASYSSGPSQFAFTTPYQIPADGAYYAVWIISTGFGTTSPTFLGTAMGNATASGQIGANLPYCFGWTGQTDLPSVGSAVTLSTLDTSAYYTAVYGTTAF